MPSSRLLSRIALLTLFAGCTATDDGDLEVEPPPEEEPAMPMPEPPPGNETPAQASQRVLDQFIQCMNIADFHTANMAVAWGRLTTNNNSQCKACHANGAGGFIANDQEQLMFDTVKGNKFYALQFVTVDLTSGPAAAKVIVNRESFKGVGLGIAPHAEHPRFAPDANTGMTALQRFYDLTIARIGAECSATPQ